AVWDTVFFDVEANFRRWRARRLRRWIEDSHDALEDVHDGGFVDIQAYFQFLLEQRQFSGKIMAITKGRPYFDKRADNENAHLDCLRAVEHVRSHYCAVFCECMGEVLYILSLLQGRNLRP